jgi:hypothetical protein
MPRDAWGAPMKFGKFTFGSIEIDGEAFAHDVVIDRGSIRKRKKKVSRKFRERFGHTPLSLEEDIPWRCRRLIVGSGKYAALPVMEEVKLEARRRDVAIMILPTGAAIKELGKNPANTNAILHVTC